MPREREEFFRLSDTKEKEKIFVLAFEGNHTEVHYFKALKDSVKFNDDLIYIHLLTRDPGDTNSSPSHVFNKLKTEAKDEFAFNEDDELWMIIDTDRWKDIPEVIKACQEEGNMYVAISNPCFELWLLLHVKDINDYTDEERELLLANGRVTSKKNYVDSKISDELGGFNKRKFKPDLFLPNLKQATSRAKELAVDDEGYPKGLGSHIFKIIEKINNEE